VDRADHRGRCGKPRPVTLCDRRCPRPEQPRPQPSGLRAVPAPVRAPHGVCADRGRRAATTEAVSAVSGRLISSVTAGEPGPRLAVRHRPTCSREPGAFRQHHCAPSGGHCSTAHRLTAVRMGLSCIILHAPSLAWSFARRPGRQTRRSRTATSVSPIGYLLQSKIRSLVGRGDGWLFVNGSDPTRRRLVPVGLAPLLRLARAREDFSAYPVSWVVGVPPQVRLRRMWVAMERLSCRRC